jgi:DNA polymerase-3 subunit beta
MLVGTKDLRGAISAVGSAVSSRPGIPALTGVKVDAEPGRVTFTATDLETSVVLELEAEPETAGETWAALVPLKPFKEAARAFKGGRFSFHPDGAGALVVNGSGSLRLLVLEDFPTLERVGELVAVLDAERFRSLVRSVEPACSDDAARPVLTGAYLELGGDGSVTLTATDSYRLHSGSMAGASVERSAIVPGRALAAVAKAIGAKGAGTVRVRTIGESALGFELELEGKPATSYVSRVIEGEFPNYRQLIPEPYRPGDGGGELHFEPAALVEAIGNAAPYCRDTSPMRLRFDAGGVRISASSPDLGEYVAEVGGCDWSGDDLTVAFNPTYLGGCVSALEGASGPVLYLRDGLKPGVVRAPGDGLARVALVMPVRMPAAVEPARDDFKAVEPAPEPEVEVVEDETDPGVAETAEPEVEVDYAREPDPEPLEPEDAAREAEVVAELEADIADGAGHVVDVHVADLPPAPVFASNGNGNGHGSTIDRTALVSRLRESASTSSEEWCELADVGDAGGVRVRLVGGPDGRPRIDARRFVDSKRYSGPTKKGWAVEPAAAATLAGLLLDAAAAAAELEPV